jgi:hypothetical protein
MADNIARRDFVKAGALSAAGAALGLTPIHTAHAAGRPVGVPSHLPERLAICYYGWDWITSALPDEPYGDLERAIVETKERGFNCVRPEMGLNWMFDLQGRRRGKLKFLDWIPGASFNLHCVDGKGGGEHDVFERVMRLFELADKHGMYVIMTEWEYQDAVAHTADTRIRDEIIGVPYNNRLMLLARQYDRLLATLKKRGLHKRIASMELINELNSPPIVCSAPTAPKQTFAEWVQERLPQPACSREQVRELADKAVAFLRERHPDLLITVDGLVAGSGLAELFPKSAQVVDHHVYSNGMTQAFHRLAGLSSLGAGGTPDPAVKAFRDSMFKPNPMSWDEVTRRATHVRRGWWPIAWLYTNIDNQKFDRWCVQHYHEYRQGIKDSIEAKFRAAAQFAAAQKLPLVVDEGFILYPPLGSRFVTTAEGREGEEFGINAAIATGHWGVMLSGYFRPNTPVWKDDGQCEWARGMNARILASARPARNS